MNEDRDQDVMMQLSFYAFGAAKSKSKKIRSEKWIWNVKVYVVSHKSWYFYAVSSENEYVIQPILKTVVEYDKTLIFTEGTLQITSLIEMIENHLRDWSEGIQRQ